MAIGDIFQLTIIQRLQTQTIENVLHYAVTVDGDRANLTTALHTWASTSFAALAGAAQSTDLTYQISRVQKIWPLPVIVANEQVMVDSGTAMNQALPAEVAAVVTKQSFLAGRANRGRVYIAGIPGPSVLVVNGLFDDPTMILLNTLGTALTAVVNAAPGPGTLQPVIYHRLTHTTTDIVTALARNTPRVQRRRQIGRGI